MRILVVEDRKSQLEAMVALIEEAGHQVVGARSAAEAVVRYREHEPALVILDYQLPDKNAVELIGELLEHDATTGRSHAALVCVTGSVELIDAGDSTSFRDPTEELRELGVIECLSKPVDLDRLFSLIDGLPDAS